MANAKNVVATIIAVLLALAFLTAGGTKLAGVQMHFEQFARWGYPSWFVYVVGLVEVAGAILVLIPATRFYGAALLAINMAGAAFTHARAHEWSSLPAPMALLFLAVIVAWYRRPAAGLRSG